jgi:hypothetical protein
LAADLRADFLNIFTHHQVYDIVAVFLVTDFVLLSLQLLDHFEVFLFLVGGGDEAEEELGEEVFDA